jgi:transcriptional regulator with XRE-family HTH domain
MSGRWQSRGMTQAEDERLAQHLRAIRRRSSITQKEISLAANVPREDVMRIERGRAGEVRLERTRRIFEAAGGRARLNVWWNGAAADRLLDERHAALVARRQQLRTWSKFIVQALRQLASASRQCLRAGHGLTHAVGQLSRTTREHESTLMQLSDTCDSLAKTLLQLVKASKELPGQPSFKRIGAIDQLSETTA